MFKFSSPRRRRLARRNNRRANRQQRSSRSRGLALESLELRQMLSSTPMTFQVVDDASANKAFRYSETGAAQGSTTLAAANAAPRGVASTIGVDKTWVIDANRNVYVYNATGGLLGSWSAGSLANNATPEGIATNGTDIWIVDSKSDSVFFYAGAASRTAGSQAATSSFSLNSGNANPKDMVTDGASLWVVDDAAKTDKVFKYTVAGALAGSWTIDAANKAPTGIALDPANIGDLWISDSGTDRVYKYAGAAGRDGGSQSSGSSFALASGNGNSQGLAVAGRAWAEAPYQMEWIRQIGGSNDELGIGVSADGAGHVYLSGPIDSPVAGADLAQLAAFDDDGNALWTRQQQATPGVDSFGSRIEADALGNVFQLTGSGNTIVKNFDSAGTLKWAASLPAGELAYDVTSDGLGYAYVATYTWGNTITVRKLDALTGGVVWMQTLAAGTGSASFGISADHLGNIFVAGYTSGSTIGPNAGGVDGLVAKFSDAGALLWARQFGSAGTDYVWNVAADDLGNVYTVGQTSGSFAAPLAGANDVFVTKHDSNGALQWVRQLGTTGDETFNGVWADAVGNVYASGWTRAALGGPMVGGNADGLVVKLSTAGDLLWAQQLGTVDRDALNDVFGDADGNIYLGGNTRGSWAAVNAGGADGVLVKLTSPPAAASARIVLDDAALQARSSAQFADAAFAAGDFSRLFAATDDGAVVRKYRPPRHR
jgi:hypothetical protein